MPEYGRGIQQMVDNVLEIADREKRLEAAKIIIGLMSTVSTPSSRNAFRACEPE